MQDLWWLIIVGILLIVAAISFLFQGPANLREQLTFIERIYDVLSGGLYSWYRRTQSESRTKLANQLTVEKGAVTALQNASNTSEKAVLISEHDLQETPARLEEHRGVEIATQSNVVTRLNKATELAVSPEKSDEIRGKEEESRIKTTEHREMKEIDFEITKLETELKVKSAIVVRIAEQFEMQMLTEKHAQWVEDRELLLLQPDTQSRRDRLKRLNKNIKYLDKAIDAKGDGLIQGDNRPKLRRVDED